MAGLAPAILGPGFTGIQDAATFSGLFALRIIF
jgi:hypothetical protein